MITALRQVHADPQLVWQFVGDVGRWAEHLPTVDRVRARTNGEPRIGSRYALKQPGLPVLVYEITSWQPGTGFTWVAAAPGVRTIGTHEIDPTEGGCTLRLGLRWEGPLAPLVGRLFGRRTDGFVQREADTFTALAEGSNRSSDQSR